MRTGADFPDLVETFSAKFRDVYHITDGGFERGYQAALDDRTDLVATENGEYTPEDKSTGFKSVTVSVISGLVGVVDGTATELTAADLLGVTGIKRRFLYEDKVITSVEFPETVTRIEEQAFGNCKNLEIVKIPPSVNYIGSYAFVNDSNLKGVYITDLEAWCNITFPQYAEDNPLRYAKNLYLNNALVTTLEIPRTITKIKKSAFVGCSATTIILHDAISSFDHNCFQNCKITSIEIPPLVSDLPYRCFGGTTITSITIPDNIKTISDCVFFDCKQLVSVEIRGATALTRIGSNTFYNCTALETVTLQTTKPPTLSSGNFTNCNALKKIAVPIGSGEAYKSATNWSKYADIIVEEEM